MSVDEAKNKDIILMARALERLKILRDAPSTDPMERTANGLSYVIADLEERLNQSQHWTLEERNEASKKAAASYRGNQHSKQQAKSKGS